MRMSMSGTLRRVLVFVTTAIVAFGIPWGSSSAQAASEQPGAQYWKVTCYVGEAPSQCGIQAIASSSSDRGFSWNTYFSNWRNGPPPGISNPTAKTWSGTFTTTTATGDWYVLDVIQANYSLRPYIAFQVAATRPPETPTITFPNPGTKSMSATPFTPTLSMDYGLTATLTSSTTSTCQVSGLSVTMQSVGTCTLVASRAASTGYNAATPVTQSFTITAGTQAPLSVTSVSGTYGIPIALTTSGGSGSGAVSFTVNSQGTTGCSLSGASFTNLQFTAPGTCTVTATKAADANYSAISSTVTSIVISKASQDVLSLTSVSGTFGTDLSLTQVGGSGSGAVTFAVTSLGSAGCSLPTPTTLRSAGAGTCVVRVDKAGDSNYNAASSPITTVSFAAREQTSAVTLTSASGKTFGSALNLAASGGSGTGAFSYSVDDEGTAGCSILGDQLTSTGDVGSTCTVRATRLGDTNYLPRNSVAQTVTVTTRASQPSLTVVAPTIAYRTPVSLASMGGGGSGAVSFGVSDEGSAGCSIIAGELRTTGGVGTTCVIFARKAESTNYFQASSPDLTVTVTSRAAQGIDFTAPADRLFTATPFTVSPLSDSGLAVTVTSTTPTICSVTEGSVTTLLPGTCALRAEQGGDANVLPASPLTQTFVISPAVQSVAWSPTLSLLSTASPLTMNAATGSDSGAVTYLVLDPGTANCAVADPSLPILTFDSPGLCDVQAESAATATHQSGTSVKTFVIAAPAPRPGGAAHDADSSADAANASVAGAILGVATMRSLDPILANAGLRPGADVATVDGKRISVRIEANATNTGLDVIGGGWGISISGRALGGSPRPLDPGGLLVLTAGSRLDVSGFGFEPLAQVRVYLMGRQVHLGSLMTDTAGDLAGSLLLPVDARLGADTLQINGFTTDREVRSISLGVLVIAPSPVPRVVGTRIFFPYDSSLLTTKAKRSLLAMISQLPPAGIRRATVAGAVRSISATSQDTSLARRRALVVASFLRAHGVTGQVASSIRRVPVTNHYRDRRVDITLSS